MSKSLEWNAFDQIIKKGYADTYRASGKNIIGIGVNFSEKKKAITGWVVKDLLNND